MRIRQIVFAAHDLDRCERQLQALAALDEPYRDPGVAEFGLSNAVFAFGQQFIEIVSPQQPGTTAGRQLERRGDSGYMLIVQTDDFESDRSRLARLGVRTVWSIELPDIRATHLHPKDVGGTILSIDQPTPPGSWRWGGPGWPESQGARQAQRVVAATLQANDPAAMAARWAEVLGLPPAWRDGTAWQVDLLDGYLRFVDAEGQPEGLAGFTLAVPDPAAWRRRAESLGLVATADGVRLMGTTLELRPVG